MPALQIIDKDKVSGGLSCLLLRPPAALRSAKSYDFEKQPQRSGQTNTIALPAAQVIFLMALRGKVMRAIKKITWAARRQWYLVVGIRWQRFQGPILALYFRRVTEPVRIWRAFGCPSSWRPQLPWWQPFVWRWLVLSRAFGPQHPLTYHPLRRSSRRRG